MKTVLRALSFIVLLVPAAAFAHSGPAGHTHGFAYGFMHPLGGIDHVLAMVAVGLLAAHLGGRALVIVPLSFVVLMAAGGALGFAGITLPYTEIAIALSVIVLGALVAFRANLPLALASSIAGGFAIFHGYAHGAELPAGSSALSYAAGFLIATALLHVAGIAAGLGLAKAARSSLGQRAIQASGGAMALAGVVLIFQAI